jgi:hypothetical protein
MDIEKRKKQVRISSAIAGGSLLNCAITMVIYLITGNNEVGLIFLICMVLFIISIMFFKEDQTTLDEFDS